MNHSSGIIKEFWKYFLLGILLQMVKISATLNSLFMFSVFPSLIGNNWWWSGMHIQPSVLEYTLKLDCGSFHSMLAIY